MAKKKTKDIVKELKEIKENIYEEDITDLFLKGYKEYAEESGKNRAFCNVLDGLKPVQRKIIYSMYDLKVEPQSPYKKCARIVGDVIGKYHPHGDTSTYEALTKMAQDFNKRYPLIDGHGNYGTTDDKPAAYRYTECRLHENAMKILKYLDPDIVEFVSNFDGEEIEPSVLPSLFPNVLANGTWGIAAGISTGIPPHNLNEVIDGLIAYIDNPKIELKEMLKYIKGPDFPTYGIIDIDYLDLYKIYSSGIGNFKIKGNIIEEKNCLIINQMPYKTKRCSLMDKLYKTFREERLVKDIRDESDREEPLRIVIELQKNISKIEKDEIKKQVDKINSSDKNACNCNFVLVYNDKVVTLSLMDIIKILVEHKIEILKRKFKKELSEYEEQKHKLQGILIALDDKNLDDIINLLRNCKTTKEQKEKLIEKYNLSNIQATYIVDIKFSKLARMESEKIQKEYNQNEKLIKKTKKIIESNSLLKKELKKELNSLKDENDKRRTTINILNKK